MVEVKVGVVNESFTPTGIPDKLHELVWVVFHLMVETPLPVKADGSAVREVIAGSPLVPEWPPQYARLRSPIRIAR